MQPTHDQDAPERKSTYSEMARSGWTRRPLVKYACQLCGKERETKIPTMVKWCSNSCNWKAHRDLGYYDKDRACVVCKATFRARPNRGKRYRDTCSEPCRNMVVAKKNAKLDADAVRDIKQLRADGMSQRQIAEKYKISQNVISGIIRGRSFKWVPLLGDEQAAGAPQAPPVPVVPAAPPPVA